MKTINKLLLLMLLSIIGVASCDDHQIEEPKLDKVILKDMVLSSQVVNDLFFDINHSVNKEKSFSVDDCITVKNELSEDGKNFVLRLIYDNCTTGGIVKNGEIKVNINKKIFEVEFINLTINDKSVDGKMQITLINPEKFATHADLKLDYADGSSISWKANQTIQALSDGTWKINGEITGKARNVKSFIRKDIDLIKNKECPWYVGGRMELVFDKEEKYDIEFTSECGEIYYTHNGIRAKLPVD